MTDFVIPAPPRASVAVAGSSARSVAGLSARSVAGSSARFPVRRIYCVGRNYEAHVREMGKDPSRAPPFFFSKPADAAVPAGQAVPYPPQTEDLHHEIELVVALGRGGADVSEADVPAMIWGATVGVDLTRRDLQAEAKAAGRPWDMAKGFDASAPLAPLVPIADVPSLTSGRIWLAVNGELRQEGDIGEMIWSVAEHVSILSRSVRLAAGDLIMTGTPAGVGAVVAGDTITGGVEGLAELTVPIA